MIEPTPIDDLLNRAFHLARFIQGDRQTAIDIVARAMARLEVATVAQGKRLYYKPIGRSWTDRFRSERFRNKVFFNELHLLQRLIYAESEPYEIQQEQGNSPTTLVEEDLLIHFIKHLVKITVKRNSFYVTLGLSRLLYNYSTAETMEIYNAVIQDPERVKDDYYYRSRKGVLMQELKGRFGDLVKVYRGARGEERFHPHDNPGRFAEVVEECLRLFTPWGTPCLVPAGINPVIDGIPQLSYQGYPQEDKIEVDRIHAVLHPNCFERLIRAMGLAAPDRRLEIPYFFLSEGSNSEGESGHRDQSDKLDEEELLTIKRDLDEQGQRRRSVSAGQLRILVDGVERGQVDLNRGRTVHFNLNKDAEQIEVRARSKVGNELLLATHLFANMEEQVQPVNTSIILERGQKISITVSTAADAPDAAITVTYQETNALSAAALYFRQWAQAISDGHFGQRIWSGHRILVPLLALVLVAVGIATVARYLRGGMKPAQQSAVVNAQQAGPSIEEQRGIAQSATQTGAFPAIAKGAKVEKEVKLQASAAGERRSYPLRLRQQVVPYRQPQPVAPSQKEEIVAQNAGPGELAARASERTSREADVTRSLETRSAAVSLSRVKKLFVEFHGGWRGRPGIREALLNELRASPRFVLSPNRDEADALMKVSQLKGVHIGSGTTACAVRLINARGEVIWPTERTGSGGNYHGSIATMCKGIVEDLLRESDRPEHR